jgi:hypothetical protein
MSANSTVSAVQPRCAQQRDVVDPLELLAVEPQLLAEAHREQADAESLLHRLAHPDVDGQRHRGHDLGEPEPV